MQVHASLHAPSALLLSFASRNQAHFLLCMTALSTAYEVRKAGSMTSVVVYRHHILVSLHVRSMLDNTAVMRRNPVCSLAACSASSEKQYRGYGTQRPIRLPCQS